MSITKTVKVHTSNYLFQPAKDRELLFLSYLKFAPLLGIKTIYGKYVPKPIRIIREKLLNKRRRKKMA